MTPANEASITAGATSDVNSNAATTPASDERNMLAAALEYASQGLAVFPLHTPIVGGGCSCGSAKCGSPGKHRRITNGCKAATTDADQICRWWAQWPNANIGIATGAGNNLLVVDVVGSGPCSDIIR